MRSGLASPEPALVRQLTGHRSAVHAVDWSPDGALVAGGATDGGLRLWDPHTGNTVAVIDTGRDLVSKVAWAPDGRRLAAMSRATLFVRDGSGRPVGSPLDGLDGVQDFAWSPDGCRIALIEGIPPSGTGTLRIRDVGSRLDEFDELEAGLFRVSWSGDGGSLATVGTNGAVEVWDVGARRRTGSGRSFRAPVTAVSWVPRSRIVAVVSARQVHLWFPSEDTVIVLNKGTAVASVAWAAAGDRPAFGHLDVRVWQPAEACWVTLGRHTGLITGMAWAPSGDRLATAGSDNEVQIWDTTAVGCDAAADRRPGWVRAAAVSPDGGRIATIGGQHRDTWPSSVQVHDVADGSTATATTPTLDTDRGLAWSADGTFLRIAGAEPRRWEVATGLTTPLPGWLHNGGSALLGTCAWAPGGTRLAVVNNGQIRLWDADDPAEPATIGFPGRITSLSWSANALSLAVSSRAGTAVWEIIGDQARFTRGNEHLRDAVLAWSPDSSQLAAAVRNGPLILWDPVNDEATTITSRVGPITGVAWSPDGRHMITTSEEGAVVVHPVDGASGSRIQLAGANCVAWAASTIAVGQRTGLTVLELRADAGLRPSG